LDLLVLWPLLPRLLLTHKLLVTHVLLVSLLP
jgi:hypothetical protein